MLSATITWTATAWVYVVRDGDEALERGVLRGARWDDEAGALALQLRVRWPGLEPSGCLVLHGPSTPVSEQRPAAGRSRSARRARPCAERPAPRRVRHAR